MDTHPFLFLENKVSIQDILVNIRQYNFFHQLLVEVIGSL